jgi:hypothetical protein
LKLCRNILIRFFVVLVIISSFLNLPAYSQESEDSQVFISGFNAYQQKDYPTTIQKMNEVLQKFPDTPLRDMVLFWLSRAYYKNGNQQDAARYMSQFSKEYPDNPLKGTVDEELLALAARYDKGEKLPNASLPVVAQKKDQDKLAKQKAEQDRLATLKADQARKAAEQAAIAKRTAEEAEQARLTAIQKEQERAVVAKAEADRVASEKAEQERLAAAKADQERKVAEQAAIDKRAAEEVEQARLAVIQKEQDRAAALKAEAERKVAEKAELQHLAAVKADQERTAAEKAEQLKAESEKVDMEQVARQQAEMVRLTQSKAEQKRLAVVKAEEGRIVAEKAAKTEQNRIVAAKAEEERIVAAAEEQRMAAIKAKADRLAAEKSESQRLEREKVEQERKALAAAEASRLTAAQKELERKAAATAEAERLAQEQAAAAKRAAIEAEQQKLALVKQEQERVAAERAEKERQAAAAAEASQQAAIKQDQQSRQPEKVVAAAETVKPSLAITEERRLLQQREAEEKTRAAKTDMREKAIAQYKSVLVTYPNTKAATVAAAKLKELGVAVAVPVQVAVEEPQSETAQVLHFEVAQFAGVELTLLSPPQTYNVAQRISIPFEVTNQGNGSDSFYLESGFPTEFSAAFSSAGTPSQAINQTHVLAPGESFKGLVSVTIPASSIDGLRITYPIKASSRMVTEATQSREVRVIAAAPLLRATVKADRSDLLPGDKIIYRVALLNVGSTGAQDVSFRLNFPPQLEPVDFAASGFRQEMKAALVIDGLQLKSGESREFNLAFQLKEGSLAGQEILTRAELQNNQLKTTSVFVSSAAFVQPQHGLLVTPGSERLVVIPGQTVSVPFVITNTGNVREKFSVASSGNTTGQVVTVFHDLNRDGVRQSNEPVVSEIGPLAAKEEASIVMEIQTPRSAIDGSESSAQISFRSEGSTARSFDGITRLIYSRPVLQMAMSGRDGKLKPGEVASFDLTITNRGSNLARIVELKSSWPEQLELVAADPATSSVSNGALLWKFNALGAGEKRVIKVSFRVKPGIGMGTNIQVKNILTYEDQIGNRY